MYLLYRFIERVFAGSELNDCLLTVCQVERVRASLPSESWLIPTVCRSSVCRASLRPFAERVFECLPSESSLIPSESVLLRVTISWMLLVLSLLTSIHFNGNPEKPNTFKVFGEIFHKLRVQAPTSSSDSTKFKLRVHHKQTNKLNNQPVSDRQW
jgi:hypothetical protein